MMAATDEVTAQQLHSGAMAGMKNSNRPSIYPLNERKMYPVTPDLKWGKDVIHQQPYK